MAEAVNEVCEDTTGGIVVVSSISITAEKETELSSWIFYAKRASRIQNGKRPKTPC
jgi:hypothetical protein